MALSGRTKIGIVLAGAAGAAALGLGGAALADPGAPPELRIVSGHDEAPGTTGGPGMTGASWNAGAPGKDCPEKRTATPDPAQAADGR
ncbi:hypothetical protein [Actinomadura rugatobispora]|uniref:Uncharacterized protein n=1 Tax=Actinomadura rugatobispora TaxID=1994 RepID=A0ABW1AJZ2_9ACTN|nr:hypothetical protein GCM10010200_007250 [Actinomadura rugatobispora]